MQPPQKASVSQGPIKRPVIWQHHHKEAELWGLRHTKAVVHTHFVHSPQHSSLVSLLLHGRIWHREHAHVAVGNGSSVGGGSMKTLEKEVESSCISRPPTLLLTVCSLALLQSSQTMQATDSHWEWLQAVARANEKGPAARSWASRPTTEECKRVISLKLTANPGVKSHWDCFVDFCAKNDRPSSQMSHCFVSNFEQTLGLSKLKQKTSYVCFNLLQV